MLKFKEYIENEAFNPINFVGGFAGNLIGQGIKGSGNLIKGLGKSSVGTMGTATGVVGGLTHGLLGEKERAKKSIDFSKKSLGVVGGGIQDIVKGIIQLGGAASLLTPFLRGVQASAEPFIPTRMNRNRNKVQKMLGLNSSQETPYIIDGIPSQEELIKFIDTWYNESINNREIQVRGKPEVFIKNLINLYNSTNTNKSTNKKIQYLLNTYFSNFEIIIIEAGKILNKINNEIFFSDSKIIQYIDFLHKKSKKENVVLITQNNKLFIDELIKIHNEYLSSKNLISEKDRNTTSLMKEYKNKIVEIINKFFPNKKIKTSKA